MGASSARVSRFQASIGLWVCSLRTACRQTLVWVGLVFRVERGGVCQDSCVFPQEGLLILWLAISNPRGKTLLRWPCIPCPSPRTRGEHALPTCFALSLARVTGLQASVFPLRFASLTARPCLCVGRVQRFTQTFGEIVLSQIRKQPLLFTDLLSPLRLPILHVTN